jgi:hypothetical protein
MGEFLRKNRQAFDNNSTLHQSQQAQTDRKPVHKSEVVFRSCEMIQPTGF